MFLAKKVIFVSFIKTTKIDMRRKPLQYIVLTSLIIASTSCSLSYQLKKADMKYALGEYAAAGPLYKRILPRIPAKDKETRAVISTKIGHCYKYLNVNTKSSGAYRTAVRYKSKDPELYLGYADVLMRMENYSEARTYYRKYLAADSVNNTWVMPLITSCNNVKQWQKIPSDYSVTKMNAFNDRRGDFGPAVGDDDGNVVYLTSSRKNQAMGRKLSKITGVRNNDIYVVKKDIKGKWDKPLPIPGDFNSTNDEGACTVTADGRMMYFTLCRYEAGKTLGAEIYRSERSGGEWMAPQKVELVKDSSITTAHPAMSPDDSYLYFVSDMEGGYGGKDIWRCAKKSDNEWGTPVNLGPEINTAGDEMFPTFRYDGTLYFSSNGRLGFGGLDIYKAEKTNKKGEKDTWKVTNLLTPVNSSSDDFGMTFIGKEDRGYFSSNRQEPKGYDKIYMFDVPEVEFVVKGQVLDNKGEPVSDAVIRIIGDNGVNTKIKVKKDGSYKYKLEKGVKYVMQASARGFLNEKGELSTVGLRNTKSFTNDFGLPAAGKPVTVDNIFFDFGKYTLRKESEEALQGIVKRLNDNPNITIEIGAHTDMVGSEDTNMNLSAKRAESVVKYLIESGIDKERLTSKGYGETKPVEVDAELAKEYSFLKEGDILNEEFLMTLTDDEREMANQINRRIEFTVLKMTYKMF